MEQTKMGRRGEDDRLPTGLMMALAQNMHAMEQYAALGEDGRARLIERAANTHSQSEMQALVRNMEQFR